MIWNRLLHKAESGLLYVEDREICPLFFCLKRGSGAIYSLKGSKEARLILRAGKEKGEDAYE